MEENDLLYGNPPEALRNWANNVLPSVRSPRIQDLSGRNALMESMDETLRQIQAAKQHLNTLRMKLTKEHSILHGHVRKLPDEVLSHILGIHLCSTLDSVPFDDHIPCPGRLLPLEVCRRWRDVTLANPTCWTTLVIDTRPAYSKAFKSNLLRQIRLSRSLPIHFIIQSHESHDGEAIYDILQLCLKENISRIQSYAETGDAFKRYSMLAMFLQERASSLTHLHLERVQLPAAFPSSWVLPALKYLYIDRVDPRRLRSFLERCPTVEYLTYRFGSYATDSASDGGFGTLALQNLHGLRRLALPAVDLLVNYWRNAPESNPILPQVKTINLLNLINRMEEIKFCRSSFEEFQQHFPNLEHLILTNIVDLNPRGWDDNNSKYTPMVNIQHITFEGSIDVDQVLHALKLFKNLRTIHLSRFFRLNIYMQHHSFSWDDLYASLPTILEDHTPLGRRTKACATSPMEDEFTKAFVNILLRAKEDTSVFIYCPGLEHLTLTGFTIDASDAEHLLDLLALRQGEKKGAPSTESSGLTLTLSDCFTPDVSEPEDRANLNAKGMDYPQAQGFFRQRAKDLKRTEYSRFRDSQSL